MLDAARDTRRAVRFNLFGAGVEVTRDSKLVLATATLASSNDTPLAVCMADPSTGQPVGLYLRGDSLHLLPLDPALKIVASNAASIQGDVYRGGVTPFWVNGSTAKYLTLAFGRIVDADTPRSGVVAGVPSINELLYLVPDSRGHAAVCTGPGSASDRFVRARISVAGGAATPVWVGAEEDRNPGSGATVSAPLLTTLLSGLPTSTWRHTEEFDVSVSASVTSEVVFGAVGYDVNTHVATPMSRTVSGTGVPFNVDTPISPGVVSTDDPVSMLGTAAVVRERVLGAAASLSGDAPLTLYDCISGAPMVGVDVAVVPPSDPIPGPGLPLSSDKWYVNSITVSATVTATSPYGSATGTGNAGGAYNGHSRFYGVASASLLAVISQLPPLKDPLGGTTSPGFDFTTSGNGLIQPGLVAAAFSNANLVPPDGGYGVAYSPTLFVGWDTSVVVVSAVSSVGSAGAAGTNEVVPYGTTGHSALVLIGGVPAFAGQRGLSVSAAGLGGVKYLVVAGTFCFPRSFTGIVVRRLADGKEWTLSTPSIYSFNGVYQQR